MADTKAAAIYPMIYESINVPAQIVWSDDQVAQLGDGYQELDLASQGLTLTQAP